MPRGGTIIGTTNRGHSWPKSERVSGPKVAEKVIADAREVLKSLGVDGLIIVGGDGLDGYGAAASGRRHQLHRSSKKQSTTTWKQRR